MQGGETPDLFTVQCAQLGSHSAEKRARGGCDWTHSSGFRPATESRIHIDSMLLKSAVMFLAGTEALRIDPSLLSRRQAVVSGVAAAGAAFSGSLPAFAERNVVTKEEAKLQAAQMVRRTDAATECDARCEKEIEERRKRRQLILEKKATFEEKVANCEKATKSDAWVAASQDLIAYLKEEAKKPDPISHPPGKSVPEGVKIKEIVKRLRASYNALPTKRIKCGADVRPDVKCYSAGEEVEAAYNTLIAELRRNAGCATLDCKGSATEAF